MWRGIVISALTLGALGCGGLSKQEAAQQLDQLMVLYDENRPKFVLQKQELEKSCGRATSLREAADAKVKAAAMSAAEDETLTLVQMELTHAEKNCLSR